MTTFDYIPGETSEETYRLTIKTDAKSIVEQYIAPFIHPQMKFLDVGGGPGLIAKEVAQRWPQVDVVSFDASEIRTEAAQKNLVPYPNAHALQGDAYQIPFADDHFDLVFSRFLIQHLPQRQAATQEMVRVAKNRVLLQESDGVNLNYFPKDTRLHNIVRQIRTGFDTIGYDPETGRQLTLLLEQCGLHHVHFFPPDWCHKMDGIPDTKILSYLQMELDAGKGLLTQIFGEQVEDVTQYILDFAERADTIMFGLLFTATGTKT